MPDQKFDRTSLMRKLRLLKYDARPVANLSLSSEGGRYQVPYICPPDSPLDTDGLESRIEWAEKIRTVRRNISPRQFSFIMSLKNDCETVLRGKWSRKDRSEKSEDIKVASDMLISRYEEIHGSDGLCAKLIDSTRKMAEMRLYLEYGDYLAISCEKLKTNAFKDTLWMLHPELNCQKVATFLRSEQEWRSLKQIETYHVDFDNTPWTNDVVKAAKICDPPTTPQQLLFEIETYVSRNHLCHCGIKALIDTCNWEALAQRIVRDKEQLQLIYRDDPHGQIQMRACIRRIETDCFEKLWMEGDMIRWVPTVKADQKLRKYAKKATWTCA